MLLAGPRAGHRCRLPHIMVAPACWLAEAARHMRSSWTSVQMRCGEMLHSTPSHHGKHAATRPTDALTSLACSGRTVDTLQSHAAFSWGACPAAKQYPRTPP